MNEEQIKIAQEELCDYLEYQCDVDEELLEDMEFLLGMKEEEVEDRIFFAFKYKKSADGKQFIGVAGGFEDEDDDECPIVVADNFECPEDLDDAASVALYLAIFGIQRAKAKAALCDFLENSEEMDGEEPEEIEYCHVIRGERIKNRIFFVFKFKKPDDDAWYIGIGGGYKNEESTDCLAAFSGFDEYPDDKDKAVGFAFAIAEFLLKHVSKNMNNIQAAVEQNMKYITSPADPKKIARQFVKTETRTFITVGTVDIPSGRVIVADPLSYLSGANKTAPVLEKEIPAGSYPAEIALFRGSGIGIRICTARLKIKDTDAVKYELARPTAETQFPMGVDVPSELEGGVVCGFPVEAGMMCFIDAEGAKDYEAYIEAFHKNNPGKNHYDDYFKVLFMASAQALPQYQRSEGDFIAWNNPINSQSMIMAASGLGDGIYLPFWGYDEDDEICELIVPMIDPDLFENPNEQYYDEDDEKDEDDEDEDDENEGENFLNTLWQDAYTANPKVYETENGELIVNFTLTEDTNSIFPLVPEEHWQVEGKTISKWILSVFSIENNSVFGTFEYHEAMKRLEGEFLAIKDGWALIRGLDLDDIEEDFDGLPRDALK